MAANTDTTTRSRSEVEILHEFVSGDGGRAFEAFLEGFRERNPGITVSDRVEDNTSLTVKTRILREDPPDAWIEWGGETLRPYAEAGVLRDVSHVWERTDMEQGYYDITKEVSRFDGAYRIVPISIHRVNNLYYDVEHVETAGIDIESASSPSELLSMLRRAEAETGAAGMLFPMENPWTVLQLWEIVLLGEYGTGTFEAVTTGGANAHRSEIEDSIDLLAEFIELATDEAIYTSLTDANDEFVDGRGVCFQQGDWTGGAFGEMSGFEFGRDWESMAFPGTGGEYLLDLDALIPTHATEDKESVDALLEYAGTPEALERFSRIKGSIAPRRDVSIDRFAEFQCRQQQAFESSRAQPKSIAHGLSVQPSQLVELKAAMANYIATRNVGEAAEEVVSVLDKYS